MLAPQTRASLYRQIACRRSYSQISKPLAFGTKEHCTALQ